MDDDSSMSLSTNALHMQELRDEEEIARIKRKVQELKKRTQRNKRDRIQQQNGGHADTAVTNLGRGVVDVVGTVDPRSWAHRKRRIVSLCQGDHILHPQGRFRVTWDTCLALLVIYNTGE
jgi:hypothetical protein